MCKYHLFFRLITITYVHVYYSSRVLAVLCAIHVIEVTILFWGHSYIPILAWLIINRIYTGVLLVPCQVIQVIKTFQEMNSYVGMTRVKKEQRQDEYFNQQSILLTLPANTSPLIISNTYVSW